MRLPLLSLSVLSSAAVAQTGREVTAVSGDALRTRCNGRVRLKAVDGSVLLRADSSEQRVDSLTAGGVKPRQPGHPAKALNGTQCLGAPD